MLNILDDYIRHSLPDCGYFSTNPNLRKKVGDDGAFLPFFGNTIIFDLSDATKQALKDFQEELYRAGGWMLSQRLDSATFHMTLHDLVNGPELTDELTGRIRESKSQAKAILGQWMGQPPLRMRTTWLFNMVNTSIVLGLTPADADSWDRLDGMYTALESVVPLGYALTPHITMAYFKPGTYSQDDLIRLRRALRSVQLDVELPMDALFYREFGDMDHYF